MTVQFTVVRLALGQHRITRTIEVHDRMRRDGLDTSGRRERATCRLSGRWVVALWCLVSVWGCAPHAVVQPAPQEHSAIAFAPRVLKAMSKGLEKLRVSLGTTVQEKGTYRIFAGDFFPHDVTMAQMMENFARFCTHLGGTMTQSVCQERAEDAKQVKFLVRIENQSPTGKEFVRWHVTIYEPIDTPSTEFLRAIELYR